MTSRGSGRKTTTRSNRFTSSGRSAERTARSTRSSLNPPPASSPNPVPRAAGIADPRFDVTITIVWRKSTVLPASSVRRPASNTWRNTSQTSGAAFSNSSSRTTENGFGAHLAGERAASARIAGRGQPAKRVGGLQLAHVDPDQAVGRAEQVLGEGAGNLRLAGAGGADEQHRPVRPAGIGQPGLDQRDAGDERIDRLALPEHAAREPVADLAQIEPDGLVQDGPGHARERASARRTAARRRAGRPPPPPCPASARPRLRGGG